MDNNHFLGIDIGSVSIAYVQLDAKNRILKENYQFHHGNILNALHNIFNQINLNQITQIGYNQRAEDFFTQGICVNDQIALTEGIKLHHPRIRSLFTVGAETFGLILFDDDYRYHKYISNSSCAAGTGSFLDQQAERLGLSSAAELNRRAIAYQGDPPKIATRCAVFAKTDLIHCQQQGYSINAICAGLCRGLAQNIADTLLGGVTIEEPILVVGGVSKNTKVLTYLAEIIGRPVTVPQASLLTGAIGCALVAKETWNMSKSTHLQPSSKLFKDTPEKRHYFYKPLEIQYTSYPDFEAHQHDVIEGVEVDLYRLPGSGQSIPVYLGIDIGSTSTKAVIMRAQKKARGIICGLYTPTRGQPVEATQSLFKVIREIEKKYAIEFCYVGAGTTGSGRKFLQRILNADFEVDEITAHARAASNLNPETDTIIEIGGQDSKFTVMNKGRVIFSVMNYVCAAGTGSFIEEQSKRLGVQLSDYSRLALNTPSPLTSDRCTVFMERDLNHLLSQGYSKRELLATTLHSVRDNYLAKVAQFNKIGKAICFQGATAKNRALVSAFEQKLLKPIFVSRYCHLTGALGVCLLMAEQNIKQSQFRGIDFYKDELSVEEAICDSCNNHCKLNRLKISGETITWGYLCGRDESGKNRRIIEKKEFNFLRSRRKIFTPLDITEDIENVFRRKGPRFLPGIDLNITMDRIKENFEINLLNLRHKIFTISQDDTPDLQNIIEIKIGLPETLYMQEYFPFWHYLFKRLGFTVIRAPRRRTFIKDGKELSAAEFCSPMSAWHGNLAYLTQKSDYIFAPQMFEEANDLSKKNYCYYSNYAVSIVKNLRNRRFNKKIISPVVDFSQSPINNIQRIYDSLPQSIKLILSPASIQESFHQAWQWYYAQKRRLVRIFEQQHSRQREISVVLLGRPYLVMDEEMNKNIPQKFSELGIASFFQDMLPLDCLNSREVGAEYLEWNHWKYGREILLAAEYIGQNPGLYPVYLTAFKCSPDSFLLHYFKAIMNAYDRPFLILQLDEHGSDVGYETRIESAVRTFRSHFQQKTNPVQKLTSGGIHRAPYKPEIVLIPDYDTLSCTLICAAFEKAGYRAILIEESLTSITSSLRLNDGQCLPVSAISQAAIDTISKYQLDPEKVAVFLNTITNLSCNFPQYPIMAKKIFEDVGNGFEKVQILASEFEMKEFPIEVVTDVYLGYLLGGLLRKIGCKIRPYEIIPGKTNEIIAGGLNELYQATVSKSSREVVFGKILVNLGEIPLSKELGTRPKVSIIGDLYVRDNDVFNQQLIRELEHYGAEVITTPFTYILRLLAFKHKNILKEDGHFISMMKFGLLIDYLEKIERKYYKIAEPMLQEPFPAFSDNLLEYLKKYELILDHGGETAQNLLKIYGLLHHCPDVSLFIHVNPIFCCPGLVSESIFKSVEKDIGIPIVSITYDGTTTNRNNILAPYIHYLRQALAI